MGSVRIYSLTLLLLLFVSGCDKLTRRPPPAPSAGPLVPKLTNRTAVIKLDDSETVEGSLKPYVVAARASSIQNKRFAPERAFDNDPATRWSSQFNDAEWLEGLFDQRVGIREIKIHWESARAREYEIQLLDKSSNWVHSARRAGSNELTDVISFSQPVWTTGLRVECRRRATAWGYSIFEVDVMGQAKGPAPATNLFGFVVPPDERELRERQVTERLLAQAAADPKSSGGLSDDAFLDLVERRCFDYFWWETNPTNGLTRDRGRNFASSEEIDVASVAASGFALAAYAVGAERAWVTREEARARFKATLETFANGPIRNAHGCFPHFVNMFTGADEPGTEISTIDTALFLAGMITALEYFRDEECRALAQTIFERVDWNWYRAGDPNFVSHGLDSESRFLDPRWGSFTEGILIYILGVGSPTYPLPPASWDAIDRRMGETAGYRFLIEHGFQSMFRYQYPALFYDFRGRRDRTGMDYFENVVRATLAMREYCIRQSVSFPDSYGPDGWGLSAADGPGDVYKIYGFPPGDPLAPPDGTIIPYAVAGSLPFLPAHTLRTLRKLYDEHHQAWGKYGFADSLNPTLNFVSRDVIGIDQGTILLGVENYRSGLIWKLFTNNRWIQQAGQKIGWTRVPAYSDPVGPVDLTRSAEWRLIPGGVNMAAPELADSHGIPVLVPDFWENAGGSFAGYDGIAWYRGHFQLEPERLKNWLASGRPIVLCVGGMDDEDETFVNGTKVGETRKGAESARLPRNYPVPAQLLKEGDNLVAVKVVDLGGAGGIWNSPVRIGPP